MLSTYSNIKLRLSADLELYLETTGGTNSFEQDFEVSV